MAYTLSASGAKRDVIGQLRQQVASQSAGLPSQGERDNLTATLEEAEKMVEEHAGDTDSVSITISGHISQSDTALAMSKNIGVSISRGAAGALAPPDRRTPAGAPTETSPAASRTPRI